MLAHRPPGYDLVLNGYAFHLSAPVGRPLGYDRKTALPTRRGMVREAALRLRRQQDEEAIQRCAGHMGTILEREMHGKRLLAELTHEQRTAIRASAEHFVAMCPLYVEGWALLSQLHVTCGEHDQASALIEPVANALLALLPDAGNTHVPYECAHNRMFFTAGHAYVMALHLREAHWAADLLANRLLPLDPNDPVSAKGLLTREARDTYVKDVAKWVHGHVVSGRGGLATATADGSAAIGPPASGRSLAIRDDE